MRKAIILSFFGLLSYSYSAQSNTTLSRKSCNAIAIKLRDGVQSFVTNTRDDLAYYQQPNIDHQDIKTRYTPSGEVFVIDNEEYTKGSDYNTITGISNLEYTNAMKMQREPGTQVYGIDYDKDLGYYYRIFSPMRKTVTFRLFKEVSTKKSVFCIVNVAYMTQQLK